MKRLLREPLVHFLLIGAALFVAFGLAGKRTDGAAGTIVVTPGQIASLVSGFTSTWQRPPTPEDLDALIQDRVKEEIYYREAMALGLDKDDPVIKRRLRQKLEFISEDVVAQTEPTDAELNAYLLAHADAFRVDSRFTFKQVYLSPEKHGRDVARAAAALLAQLERSGGNADVSKLGDGFVLEHTFDAVPRSEIAKQFGDKFAATLAELPEGRWQGPIESGYGVHLVFIGARTDAGAPTLATARDAVLREWQNARRIETNEAYFQGLRKRYSVTIERP